MNEFEWLQQTRTLKRTVAPARDLWPGIAQRVRASTAERAPRRPHVMPWAIAAMLAAVSVLAGWLAVRQQIAPSPRIATARSVAAQSAAWKPRDPRLVGAAIELDVARRQLTLAIHAAPRDAFLRRMLKHTNEQIHHLQQLEHRAG